jgi:hypothetical protein
MPDFTIKAPIEKFGPLGSLIGIWEGSKGDDTAPGDDRGTEKNLFREQLVFEPLGQINNHEQELWGLKYSTMAWRLNEADSFHQEIGYWLWDAKEKQVMRCFMIPRGITLIAGGTAEADAKEIQLSAKLGSPVYGICSNPFLDREFKTVGYELKLTIHDKNSFSYEEDTIIQMKGRKDLFHHIDKNTMKRSS